MKITPPHGRETSDKIFLNCEYSDTTAGVRGDLVVFDLTDNRGAAGINQNTWGLRVIRHTGVGTVSGVDVLMSAGVLETDVEPTPAPTAFSGTSRGKMILVQCYGVHDQAAYGLNGILPGLAVITPDDSNAGKMLANTKATLRADIAAGTYYPQAIGWNLEDSGADFSRKSMFVKTLGMS